MAGAHDDWGITDGYFDVVGAWHPTPDTTRQLVRDAMGLPEPGPPLWFVEAGSAHDLWNPCRLTLDDGTELGEVRTLAPDLPLGYHQLAPADGWPPTRLIVHPASCGEIPRAWGLAVQTYALWSDMSWGAGDLRDLGVLAGNLAAAGGRALLISPLHQPAPAFPQEDSPYYPSSRRAWNPLLIAMDEPPPAELVCRADALIDRNAAWHAKRARLEAMFAADTNPPPLPDTIAFWNALCDEHGPHWAEWPEPIRRFDRGALAQLIQGDRALGGRAAFHQWCQHRVSEQLNAVASHDVDVIGDLAVGFSPWGADAWEFQDCMALGMRIGAPPDPFNTAGQEWGIAPFVPWRARNAGYAPFIATIRRALRNVHGLRIDHVMGLFRQFWIPADGSPHDGVYVRFPADELLAILCLEAARAGAYVVGEDLGTVEPAVRDALARRNIAGTKVLWFENDPPAKWPEMSLATVTTHDLPTIAGVWTGSDGDGSEIARLAPIAEEGASVEAVIASAHEALLASPARLRLLSADDVCAAVERPNHPGVTDQPNWRRRLPLPVEQIPVDQLSTHWPIEGTVE